SHASGLRLATATRAPAATKPSAIDRPMPRVPPVTIATRPVRSNRDRSWSWFMRGLSHSPRRRWPSLSSQVYGFGSGRGEGETMRVRRHLVVVVVCVATALTGVGLGTAHAAPPSVANPVVEGPIGQPGVWGHQWHARFVA